MATNAVFLQTTEQWDHWSPKKNTMRGDNMYIYIYIYNIIMSIYIYIGGAARQLFFTALKTCYATLFPHMVYGQLKAKNIPGIVRGGVSDTPCQKYSKTFQKKYSKKNIPARQGYTWNT